MPRGRNPRKAASVRAESVRRAVEHVEILEERRMLTTIRGGETFDYLDAAKHVVRIRLIGNITAEFIGARVRASDNSVVIRDLVRAPLPATGGGAAAAQPDGVDLFSIYVASADADAQIIITQVPSATAEDRMATPFTGSVGTIRGFNNTNADDTSTVTPDATGGVYIGARTVLLTGTMRTENIPITSNRFRGAIGVRPAGRRLFAGIQTDPSVTAIGKILIGGTITGIVNIEGSIGTFYAGNVLTGDAAGLTNPSTDVTTGGRTGGTTIANNFTIGGDVQNLYVGGSVGTTTAAPDYRSGVDMRIGGRVGYINVNNNWNASIEVRNTNPASSLGTVVQEQEYVLQRGETAGSAFLGAGLLSGSNFVNDTQNQQAGSTVGANQTVAFSGTLQGAVTTDYLDNYSLSLMAGQTVTLQAGPSADLLALGITSTFVQLGVFDPLGRLIATDIPGPSNTSYGRAFQITATLPGIYRLAVTGQGNNAFTNTKIGTYGDLPYTITASGVGDVAMGGAEVGGLTHFREPGIGVAIRTGDLGGWNGHGNVTGTTGAFDAASTPTGFLSVGSSPIAVSRGNLRALYGTNIGVETPITQTEYLDLLVPRGSVGYVHATDELAINPQGGDLTSFGDPVAAAAVGFDYQRVEAGGGMDGNLIANGSIGSIVAGSINSNANSGFTPLISSNTDGRGNDGNIDMIYVTGDVGSALFSGPGIYNGVNGNVKYMHVGGTVYRDRFFGSSINTDVTLRPGQPLRITDDSGVQGVITPTGTSVVTVTPVTPVITPGSGGTGTANGVGGTTTDPVTGVTTTVDPATGLTTTTTPGQITASLYGVRDAGGFIVTKLNSTTSVDVAASGGGGSFDITDLTTNGTGSAVTATTPTTTTISPTTGLPVTTPVTPTNGIAPIQNIGFTVDATGATGGTNGSNGGATGGGATAGGGTGTGTGGTTTGTTTTTANLIPAVVNSVNLRGQTPVNLFHLQGNNVTAINNFTAGEVASANVASLGTLVAQTAGLVRSTSQTAVVVPTNLTGTGGPSATPAAGDVGSGAAGSFPFDGFSNGIQATGSVISVVTRDGVGTLFVGGTLGTLVTNSDGKNARGVWDGIAGPVRADTFNRVNIGEGVAAAGTGALANAGVFADTSIVQLTGVDADIRGPVISLGTIDQISLTNGSILGTRVGTVSSFDQGAFTAQAFELPEPQDRPAINRINIAGNGGILGADIRGGSFGTINVEGFGILASSIATTASNRSNGTITAGGFGIRYSNIDVGTSVQTIAATGNGRALNVTNYSGSVQRSNLHRKFDPFTGRSLTGVNDLNRLFGTSRTTPVIRGVTNSGLIQDTNIVGNGSLGSLTAYRIISTNTGTPVTSSSFPMRLTFTNAITSIAVTDSIDGLQIRTGRLDAIAIGNTLQRSQIAVAGALASLRVGKNVRGNTSITAQGGNGQIGSLVVGGTNNATIVSDGTISRIIAGDLGTTISTSGAIGGVTVNNDILSTANIRTGRAIDRITVAGDIQSGAVINARGGVGRLRVGGTNSGTVTGA